MRNVHYVLALSAVVYLASLTCPQAFCVSGNCTAWPGYGALLFGWLTVGQCWANSTWLANPLLLLAWILIVLGRRIPAAVSAVAALAVSASFLAADKVIVNDGGFELMMTGVRLAYWLWLVSMAIALVAALLCAKQPDRSSAEA